ncbi:MAG: beta-galactosidase [Acetobacteraceae bacterium]|nr:beta-galactosidase [Acetobacteraceae bacterium]
MRVAILLACLAILSGPRAHAADWPTYEVIAWHTAGEADDKALKAAGITAAALIPDRDDTAPPPLGPQIAPLRAAGLRWYVESVAPDFYAPYHRWHPDKPDDWLFTETKRRYWADPTDPGVFERAPGLDDPVWLARLRARLDRVVREHAPYHPLFYCLSDEPGIADLAAAWDFDFSPRSLADFRGWLRGSYRDLNALNREWGTDFRRWHSVRPMTTDEALLTLSRSRGANLARWSDFRAWMDESFALAVRTGTDAVHTADPGALAAIEGAQIPGWGGYDYTRLARAVDVMEIYEAGANIDLVRGLDPDLLLLTTTKPTAGAAHAIWRAALEGARGVILWDEGRTLPNGPAWQPVLDVTRALSGGIARILFAARPHREPVAILYSPVSFRIQWLLDRAASEEDWTRRSADEEFHQEGAVRASFREAVEALLHAGVTPRFLAPKTLSEGRLAGIRVLFLPHAVALSAPEVAAIRAFAAGGGSVVTDGPAGLFDAHGKPRARPAFPPTSDPLSRLLSLTHPLVHLEGAAAEARLYDMEGGGMLLALHRDAGANGDAPVTLTLSQPSHITDLRTGATTGRLDRLRITLDPVAPALLLLDRD